MTVTLSVSIMAHPRRRAMVEELLEWLGDPGIPVVWDRMENRWDTGRRAMLEYDSACTHHAVIQDDVLPCRDLLEGLRRALEYVDPELPVCGYVGARRPNAPMVNAAVAEAEQRKASWITMHTLNWGPLIVVPTAALEEMIRYCDPLTTIDNYDRRLSRYWELSRGLRIWYTYPSLVDHRDGPSMVPGRVGTVHRGGSRGCRIAHGFVGAEASALDLDWTGPVVHAEVDTGRYRGPLVSFKHKYTDRVIQVPEDHHRAEKLAKLSSWTRVTA